MRARSEVQEQERHALARELHDEAGQILTALILGLGAIEKEASPYQGIATRVAELKQMTEGALESLHRVTNQLRPASLNWVGLVPALRRQVDSLKQRTHLAIDLLLLGMEEARVSTTAETAIYRVIQEALTNIVRHASARQVSLILEHVNGVVKALIEDDGEGFDLATAMLSGPLGLIGMRERIEIVGGSLSVESAPGQGTTVLAEVLCDA